MGRGTWKIGCRVDKDPDTTVLKYSAATLRRAFHEAAHAAVACHLGFVVERVSIRGDESFAGSVRMRPWINVSDHDHGGKYEICAEEVDGFDDNQIQDALRRQVVVLAAGGAGERAYEEYARIRPQGEFLVKGDMNFIRPLAGLLQVDFETLCSECRAEADDYLACRKAEVAALAVRLANDGEVESYC